MDFNFLSADVPEIGPLSPFEHQMVEENSGNNDFEPQTVEENRGNNDSERKNNNSGQESIKRGRPLGSRNKPKQNPVIYRESDNVMMPHVVQIESGADIVEWLYRLYKSLKVTGFYVMSGAGMVAEVTLSFAGSTVTIPGISQILSLTGSYFPHSNDLTLTLLASNQNVIAGTVEGILRAASLVTIVAGSCVEPSLLKCRVIPPSGEGYGNTGCPGPSYSQPGYGNTGSPDPSYSQPGYGNTGSPDPSYSQPGCINTGYTPSLDSSQYNAPRPSDSQATWHRPSLDSSQHNAPRPSYSQATGYRPSLDSSQHNAPGPSYSHATGYRPSLDSSQHNAPGPSYSHSTGYRPSLDSSQHNATGPSYSHATGYRLSLDSSQQNAPGPSDSQATGYTTSSDSSQHNAVINYQPLADAPPAWLFNNPHDPPSS